MIILILIAIMAGKITAVVCNEENLDFIFIAGIEEIKILTAVLL